MIRRLLPSPLAGFNALMPKDPGARRLAAGLAYGPHPRHRLDLYAPRRRPDGPLPILLFLYGGSWSSGMREGYGFAGRALAARDMLVAVADYRLVPEIAFPAFLEDAAAAYAWLRAHGAAHGGDPGRMLLAGHSAGAYMAAMLALDRQWLGADHRGLRGWAGLAGPYDFLPFSGPATRAAFGHVADPALTQPIAFAGPHAPPALLLHGGRDRTVSPRNSRALAARLAEQGAEAELRLFPRLGHVGMVTALALPFRARAPVLAAIAAFAARVTPAPPPSRADWESPGSPRPDSATSAATDRRNRDPRSRSGG